MSALYACLEHVENGGVGNAVPEDPILETEDLTKEFAGFVAVRSVNLRVKRGSIHALIGPNGAGKTTCFNLLTKFLAPTRGRIVFDGRDITALKPADVAQLGLGTIVPDLGSLSASDGAGKRSHRAPAPTRHLVRFLALEAGVAGARR